jgi:hypothetical protein
MNRIEHWLKYLPFLLLILFSILVAAGIHGYSFSMWHNYIDGSPAKEVIKGTPQGLRSDDWLLDLPIALSQTVHQPPFPIINNNIGLGGNILAPIKAPSLSGLSLFRPSVWGFFLGANHGIAWMWWFMVFGLFYTYYELFKIISRDEKWIALWAAVALTISPYFQMWSFHKAEILISAATVFIGFAKIIRAKEKVRILGWACLVGWAAGCMVFNFMYPPILAVTTLLLVFLTLGYFFDQSKNLGTNGINELITPVKWKLASIVFALAVFSISIFFIYIDAFDAFRAIRNTTYPGQRVSTGGGVPLWTLFADHFIFRRAAYAGAGWAPLGNECEAASFLIFFPMVWPLYIFRFLKDRKTVDWLIISISAYIIYILIYQCLGLPLWLSKATLLSHATANRVFVGLGIANFILLVRLIADLKQGRIEKLFGLKTTAFCSFIFILYLIYNIKTALPSYPAKYFIEGTLLQLGLLALLYSVKRAPRWFFAAQCFLLVPYTLNFNPIVRGGFEYIVNNPLSEKILKIHQTAPKGARWLVTGAIASSESQSMVLDNYLRMINVPSLGGYQCPPQMAIWAVLADGNAKDWEVTNQCAFIVFHSDEKSWHAESNASGVVSIYGPPGDKKIDALGVHFYLVEGKEEEFKVFFENPKFKLVDSFQNKRIYQRVFTDF